METELLKWLSRQLPDHPTFPLGLADDAAFLQLETGHDLVLTTDLVCEGVHFRSAQAAVEQIGRKALAVNLSDLAAMAASPLAAFVSLLLPRPSALDVAQRLFQGMLPLAQQFQVAIAGGDTNTWEGALVINVTAVGQVTSRGALRRSGAQPGDWLLVTGQLGGSRLGKHLDFVPRVHEAILLHERYGLHAGMDISDGLTLDLSRLLETSGVGAILDLANLPVAPDAYRWAQVAGEGKTALEHALEDGEDFELLVTAPPDVAKQILADQPLPIPVTHIGNIIANHGLWSRTGDGTMEPLKPRGYLHL